MDEQRRAKNREKKSSVNWWKWAFLGLVLVLILFVVQLMGSIQSVSINEPNNNEVTHTDQEMVFTATANREDTEQFINTFLSTVLDEEENNLSVELKDQLLVHGQLEVFQLNVPFTISFDPYILENGNVQLRASAVELGSFSLPVGATMSLVADQFYVPDFIAIDSEEEMIVINLNEFNTEQNISVEMVRIDLPEDEIQMNLYIHEDEIIDNFKDIKLDPSQEKN
ncbi:MAG TPA: YpmS family protein [Candidatus Atopostipes pullistercoris]|uniref:YpmS family protein n=1 Tax=Candidatus Atopostipes pullistercoris TaxID=2838467 RepID=A0A9D2JYM2_9LACT|nr:YpmS family protein [Candidatus Atopostipes pullistercoris]